MTEKKIDKDPQAESARGKPKKAPAERLKQKFAPE